MKRSRRASTVACDVIRVGAVLPTTRSPSTKQTRIRAALEGSTPSANLPAVFAVASRRLHLGHQGWNCPAEPPRSVFIGAQDFAPHRAAAPDVQAVRLAPGAGSCNDRTVPP